MKGALTLLSLSSSPTPSATEEIDSHIESIGRTTEKAVVAIRGVDESLSRIDTNVSHTNTSLGEQAHATNDIASNVSIASDGAERISVAIKGAPGPGGGFFLSREPSDIKLLEIVSLFEKVEESLMCPFGPGWCGNGDPCPLHNELSKKRDDMVAWLSTTSLDVFTKHPVKPQIGMG